LKKLIIIIVTIACIGLFALLNMNSLFEIYIDMTEGLATFEVKGDEAHMNGVISRKTIGRVKDLIKDHPEVKTIVMVNVPGSIDDVSNLEASRLIRKAGLNTHVPKGGMIASGGVDFFCAGVKRTAHPESTIGVHSWAGDGVSNANSLPKDHPEHQKYLDYYEEMNIPTSFYWFTIAAAPAESMYDMTEAERNEYGLLN